MILIIEDEKNISNLLKLELTHANYECDQAFDGESGLNKALNQDYELILLDLMLPRINGIEVCRQLRLKKQTPIIMLTARDEVMDKVNGLQVGADDYLAKPFAMEELLARINALLRRVSNQNKSLKYKYGEIEIDVINHHVKFKDETITLTTTEFDLLSLLVKNGGNIVTKNDILNKVSEWLDNDVLKSTMTQNLGPITAENVKKAHELIEENHTIGKIILS